MNRLALASLALVATVVLAVPAGAAAPHRNERPLGNFDSRAADSAPVPSGAKAARAKLERSLGEEGVVSVDRVTGSARLVARTDGHLTGPSGDDPAEVSLGYVGARPGVFGLDASDLDALRLTSRYRSPDGVTHLAYSQVSKGVAAYDNVLYANVASGS